MNDHPSTESRTALSIDGSTVTVTADYSLRFVQYPDRPAEPVLYLQGRRVIKAWTLQLSHQQPADPWGCSG